MLLHTQRALLWCQVSPPLGVKIKTRRAAIPANRTQRSMAAALHSTSLYLVAAGVKERKCWLNVARMCLYNGARFHGNVQARALGFGHPSSACSRDPQFMDQWQLAY